MKFKRKVDRMMGKGDLVDTYNNEVFFYETGNEDMK